MKKHSFFSRSGIFIITTVFIVYITYSIIQSAINPVKTVNAVYAAVNRSIEATGIFMRDENIVTGKDGSGVVFFIENGGRTAKGEKIAVYYQNADAEDKSKQLVRLESRINDYNYVLARQSDKPDASRLDTEISAVCAQIGGLTEDGIVSVDTAEINKLKSNVVKRSLVYKDAAQTQKYLSDVKAEYKTLKNGMSNVVSSVYAPMSGYFTTSVDGYENIMSAESADTITVSEFNELKSADNTIPQNAVGRIASDFNWYFAVPLTVEQAEAISSEKSVKLHFPAVMTDDVSVDVYRITDEDDGKVIAIFRGRDKCDKLVPLREQSVEIVLKTYEGIKVPKKAVRQVNGRWGVYCMSGKLAVFKPIETVYETDLFVIVKSSGLKSNEIFIHDQIIISGKGITDKQVIE